MTNPETAGGAVVLPKPPRRPLRLAIAGLFAVGTCGMLVRTFAQSVTPHIEQLLGSARLAMQHGDKDEALSLADQAVKENPKETSALIARAKIHEARHEYEKAIGDYGNVIVLSPKSTAGYEARAEAEFRSGRFTESVADFDKVVELEPRSAPYLWQRGISLYYAADYAGGVKQFELHKTVNPEDVENAVWHFLCVARASGVEQARSRLMPISEDTRVPMKQVHDLFAGKATAKDVLAAANAPGQRGPSVFYAHLYIGLFDEATGDVAAAREEIGLAAKDAGDDYMGDVARVHLKVLEATKPASQPATSQPAASQRS